MKIHGFNTLTLLDYPGHIGAILFLGGCNFRCPFCQNAGLVLHPEQEPWVPEEEVFSCLKKRRGVLEGICISGGEPTLYNDLPQLVRQIKNLGYKVKIDTNGTNPAMLRHLHAEGLIDYIAMDIKSSKKNYGCASGINTFHLTPIEESVDFLMHSGIDYEFRTTVVQELHRDSDFEDIAIWLQGCRRYFLQAYQHSDQIISPGFHSHTYEKMESFAAILRKKIPLVDLRGIDKY